MQNGICSRDVEPQRRSSQSAAAIGEVNNLLEHRLAVVPRRDQRPHERRLADPLHDLAKKATKEKQQHDLRDEERLRRLP